MSTMYLILAVAGWIWAGVFFAVIGFLVWKRRRARRLTGSGFEVVTEHEKPR
jgi:hypothetical protein